MPIPTLLAAALALLPFTAPAIADHAPARTPHHRVHRRHVHHHHARPSHYGVSRPMMREVARVNVCEEGGNWHVDGPLFSGGLGWMHATWSMFRRPDWPSDMADAPPYMQANAMWRFVWHFGISMPDQAGCTGSY